VRDKYFATLFIICCSKIGLCLHAYTHVYESIISLLISCS